MTEFPQRLVDAVAAELRAIYAGAVDVDFETTFEEDAVSLLEALSQAGVEFPAAPDPVWVVADEYTVRNRSDGLSVWCYSSGVHGNKPNPELADRVVDHLNGTCLVGLERLLAAVSDVLISVNDSTRRELQDAFVALEAR